MSEDLPLAREDQHTISDEELSSLMCAVQQGDAAAYSRLLCEITRRVRRVVRQQRGFAGAAEVEDLVQDVLLSVHAVRASYDPERPFIPWLMAIVRNRLADGARRYARRAAREVQVDDIDVTFADVRTNTGESALSTEALQAAVQALPPGQRQAIELLKLREMSLQEASSLTGTSIGALKVATHRAMAALRRTLRNASRVQH